MKLKAVGTDEERQAVYRLGTAFLRESVGPAGPQDSQLGRLGEEGDDTARFYAVEDKDRIVGAIRLHLGEDGPFLGEFDDIFGLPEFAPIIPPDRTLVLSGLRVRPEYAGSPALFMLISAAVEFGVDHGCQLLFCACRPQHLTLYLRLGFRTYSKTYNHPRSGLLVPLILIAGDQDYFHQVSTPFLPVLKRSTMDPALRNRLAPLAPEVRTVESVAVDGDPTLWIQDFRKVEESRRFPGLLDGLTEREKARMVEEGQILSCEQGDILIRRGAAEQALYVVLSGSVEIRIDDNLIDVEGRGDILGEIAFLLGRPRTADVFAATPDVRVLCLTETNLHAIAQEDPALIAKVYLNLSRMLCRKIIGLHRRFVT